MSNDWAEACGLAPEDAATFNGHCPFIMRANRIEFDQKRLYLVQELMDETLT